MVHIVHRRRWAWPLMLALFAAGSPMAQAENSKTAAQFDVSLGALNVGVFWIDGSTSSQAYTTTAGFRSTGLVGEFANIQVGMQARGRVRAGQFAPDQYREEVVLGRQKAATQMLYSEGVPVVTGTKLGMEDATPANPDAQTNTLDPLSATFALLRDQSRDGLCETERYMFDGARRTRVEMTTLQQKGDDLLCTGQFRRIDGYSDRDLRRSGVVEVSVLYRAVEDGFVAIEARFSSLRGTVRLTRR